MVNVARITHSQPGDKIFGQTLSNAIRANPVEEGESSEEIILHAHRTRFIVFYCVVSRATDRIIRYEFVVGEAFLHGFS